MGYPYGLQLDIGVEPDALQDVGGQVLVRVMTEPAFKVAEVEVSVRRGVEVAENAALVPAVLGSPTLGHEPTLPSRSDRWQWLGGGPGGCQRGPGDPSR